MEFTGERRRGGRRAAGREGRGADQPEGVVGPRPRGRRLHRLTEWPYVEFF